jgi:Fe-S cluster assembly ATP-binding protein
MLKVEDLWVDIDVKGVLKGVNLDVAQGETHILFGKNGSGKSTLLMTIMGFERYRVKQGCILFRGQDVTQSPVYERARMGLGLAFQRPPTIRGMQTRDLLAACGAGKPGQRNICGTGLDLKGEYSCFDRRASGSGSCSS